MGEARLTLVARGKEDRAFERPSGAPSERNTMDLTSSGLHFSFNSSWWTEVNKKSKYTPESL